MPLAHPSTPLLKLQAPVHFNNQEGAWAIGYNQMPPFSRLFLRLDHHAYNTFHLTAKKPRYNPLATPEEPVEAYFHVCTGATTRDSSVDIITLDTLDRLGFLKDSLIEPSSEGRKFFREANMSLKGALFA